MAEMKPTLTHDDAAKILELVVNRWMDGKQDIDVLLDVLVSVSVDLMVRGVGERRAAAYFRAVSDQIHAEDGGHVYDA